MKIPFTPEANSLHYAMAPQRNKYIR